MKKFIIEIFIEGLIIAEVCEDESEERVMNHWLDVVKGANFNETYFIFANCYINPAMVKVIRVSPYTKEHAKARGVYGRDQSICVEESN